MEYLGTYFTVLTDIFTLKKATNQLRADWYFPTHGVLLCTQANNSHLHSDHHLVAKSLKDNTVGLPHLVIMEDMMPLHIRIHCRKEYSHPIFVKINFYCHRSRHSITQFLVGGSHICYLVS
jgi:hypothetical protein